MVKDTRINENISYIRKAKGISQAELAKRIGMKTSTYSQMERRGNITLARIEQIADALDVDKENIIGDTLSKGLDKNNTHTKADTLKRFVDMLDVEQQGQVLTYIFDKYLNI